MSTLELFDGEGVTLAQRLRAAAQARALADIVTDAKKAVDVALEDSVREMSEASGTAFTARLDGWTAVLTDPQPKASVVDREALAGWAFSTKAVEVKERERVEVVDDVVAADAIADYANLKADGAPDSMLVNAADRLVGALDSDYEFILPEDALDQLVTSGRCHLTPDALVDADTGEHVPGVKVSTARQTLQVRGKPDAKAAVRREVGQKLGIRPELYDGGA